MSVIDKINSGIDFVVANSRVGRHVRAPLCRVVAEQVVSLSRQLVECHSSCVGVCTGKSHAHELLPGAMVQSDRCFRRRQEQAITAATSEKLVGSARRLKTKWQIHQGGFRRRFCVLRSIGPMRIFVRSIFWVRWNAYVMLGEVREFAQEKQEQECEEKV